MRTPGGERRGRRVSIPLGPSASLLMLLPPYQSQVPLANWILPCQRRAGGYSRGQRDGTERTAAPAAAAARFARASATAGNDAPHNPGPSAPFPDRW